MAATGEQDDDGELTAVHLSEGTEPAEMNRAFAIGAGTGFSVDGLVITPAGAPRGSELGCAEHTGHQFRNQLFDGQFALQFRYQRVQFRLTAGVLEVVHLSVV